MIMDDKLKGHIQCLIENVGVNATRHKDQERAMKEAKEVMEEIVKNCSIPDVSQRSELLKVFIEWHNEEFSNYDELPEHIIDMFIKQTFNCG